MKISTTELLIVLAVVTIILLVRRKKAYMPSHEAFEAALSKMMGKSIKNLRAGMTEDDEEKREQKTKE